MLQKLWNILQFGWKQGHTQCQFGPKFKQVPIRGVRGGKIWTPLFFDNLCPKQLNKAKKSHFTEKSYGITLGTTLNVRLSALSNWISTILIAIVPALLCYSGPFNSPSAELQVLLSSGVYPSNAFRCVLLLYFRNLSRVSSLAVIQEEIFCWSFCKWQKLFSWIIGWKSEKVVWLLYGGANKMKVHVLRWVNYTVGELRPKTTL